MDLCAELTLQIIRFVQQPRNPPSSPREWVFFPEGRRVAWPLARTLLADAPKPLMVAPLAEPGMIGSWRIRALTGDHLAKAEHGLANQQQWLSEHATRFSWARTDLVLFETEADQLELSVAELERWLKEYALPVGWTVGEGPDKDRPGRLLIRRSRGDWSPGLVGHSHG